MSGQSQALSYTHAHGYRCPFCLFLADPGRADSESGTWNRASDLVHQGSKVTAFVSPEWWPNNPGHVLLIPNGYHLHVFPRYARDDLYRSRKARVSQEVRAEYAGRLRDALPSPT